MSDTSQFRDPNYHRPTDTPENLNYDDMARMADGFLKKAVGGPSETDRAPHTSRLGIEQAGKPTASTAIWLCDRPCGTLPE